MNNYSKIITNAKNCFNTEIQALNRTAELLNEDFAKAVGLINNCNKVIITGVGKSGIIGQKIAATFSSIGVTAISLNPMDALHGDIGMLQQGDAVILISKSGNTEELVKLMPYLKMHSAQTIAIVGNITSYIATNADVTLNASVEKESCPFNLAPTASTTVALAIGDALAVCLMIERKFTLEQFSKLHPSGQIGRSITLTVKDVMKMPQEIPILTPNCTLKDALIEMTRKPVGCVCVCMLTVSKPALEGIITDGDIRRFLQNAHCWRGLEETSQLESAPKAHLHGKEAPCFDILALPLSDVMTRNPVVISQDATLVEALALMENREHQINVLPVVDNKARVLLGLIRIHDVI